VNWRSYVAQRLREIGPERVCALDAAARDVAIETLGATALVSAADGLANAPCEIALGVDALDGLDARSAQQLINRTRLYLAPRILLVVPTTCVLDEDAFRALGFTLAAVDADAVKRIHEYDLSTYKTIPDWLNARFWAHPERWEP
jgi:hypothetical protein